MDERSEPTDPPIDLPRHATDNSERQVDTDTYVSAFNAVSMPGDLPAALKADIETKSDRARDMAEEAGFATARDNGTTEIKLKQRREQDAEDNLDSYLAAMEDQAERQREHEREWLQSTHTYAGQTMTGDEWRKMADWFRDPANAAAWEDTMMAETGQSRDEVRRTGGKMKRFYDLMDKEARGTLTDDERRDFEVLQSDRDVRRGIEVQQEVQELRAASGFDQTADSDQRLAGSQLASVTARAKAYEDDAVGKSGLAAVPPLAPVYQDAALGIAKPATVAPAAPVAANTVQISPDNMFG